MIESDALVPYDWEHYETEFHPSKAYEDQEVVLQEALAQIQPDPASILEVGPGLGRITRRLLANWPYAEFSAADIALAPLAVAAQLSGGLAWEFHLTEGIQAPKALHAFYGINAQTSNPYLPNPTFDLVVAIEVLMHISPTQVNQAVVNLLAAVSKAPGSPSCLLTCDWTEALAPLANGEPRPIRVQNNRHDYRAIFKRYGAEIIVETKVGLQTIFLVRP